MVPPTKSTMILSEKKAEYNEKTKKYHTPLTKGQKCPYCSQVMKVRDSKKRECTMRDGTKCAFQNRRYRCEQCKTVHVENPSNIVAFKRYDSETIQEAIDGGDCDGLSAEESTIRRWKTKFFSALKSAVKCLDSIRLQQKSWLPTVVKKYYEHIANLHPKRIYYDANPL